MQYNNNINDGNPSKIDFSISQISQPKRVCAQKIQTSLDGFFKEDTAVKIELLDVFLTQLKESKQKIEEGFLTEDYEVIRQASHKIKSTLRIIGLNQLSGLMGEIEKYSRAEEELLKIKNLFYQFCCVSELDKKEVNKVRDNYQAFMDNDNIEKAA